MNNGSYSRLTHMAIKVRIMVAKGVIWGRSW